MKLYLNMPKQLYPYYRDELEKANDFLKRGYLLHTLANVEIWF
jgi:hypothetical protein